MPTLLREPWVIEEIGDYSMVLSRYTILPPKSTKLLPNPTNSFIAKYGRYDVNNFEKIFGTQVKDSLHTPETVVVYFEDKVPSWAEVGMEVLY